MIMREAIQGLGKGPELPEGANGEGHSSHLLSKVRVGKVEAKMMFEYAAELLKKTSGKDPNHAEVAAAYDERAVQFEVTSRDLANWEGGGVNMPEASSETRIKGGEAIVELKKGLMEPERLDELLGPQSVACKATALQTAILRGKLRAEWDGKDDKKALVGKLDEQDAATHEAILAEGLERAYHYALKEPQKAQVEKAYAQAMEKGEYRTACQFVASLQGSPVGTMKQWGNEKLKSFVDTADQAVKAGQPGMAAEMGLFMANHANPTVAAEGRRIAYNLVKSGEIQKLAEDGELLQLRNLATLGRWAEQYRKHPPEDAGDVGTDDLHWQSLNQSLEIAQRLVEKRRTEQSMPMDVDSSEEMSKLPQPAQRNVRMEAAHDALLCCHTRLINHLGAAKADTTECVKAASAAAEQALKDEAPEAVLNQVSDLAESAAPQAHVLAAEIVRKQAFMDRFGPAMTVTPMMLDDEIEVSDELTEEELEDYSRDLMSSADHLPFQYEAGEAHAGAVFAICEANLRTNQSAQFSTTEIADAAKVMHELGDEEEALRGLDLLCKQGAIKQATVLARGLLKSEGEGTLDPVYDAEFSPSEESATELVRQARVIRTLHAYAPGVLGKEAGEIIKAAGNELDAAVDRNEFDAAVQFAEVYEATLPTKQIKEAVGHYGHVANSLMTKANELLNATKAGEEGFTANVRDALDATTSALKVAGHNRELNLDVLRQAKELRGQLVEKLKPGAMAVDGGSDAIKLRNVAKEDLTMQRLAGDLNSAIGRAEQIQTNLVAAAEKAAGRKMQGEEDLQKSAVNRFTGELNVGCPDVRAYCYTSGADDGSGDHEQTKALASSASVAAQSAYRDFCNADFSRWDPNKTHLLGLAEIRKEWDQAAAEVAKLGLSPEESEIISDAVYNDLHRAKSTPTAQDSAERKKLRKDLENCESEDEFIAKRVKYYAAPAVKLKAELSAGKGDQAYENACRERCAKSAPWKNAKKSAEDAVGVFAMKAGYLLEERMYQLMPDQERHQWSEQDTSLFKKEAAKKSRPDIVQSFDKKHKVLLDLTAQNSGGHIFTKAKAWVLPEVTAAIEITYPSLDRDALRQCMLRGAKLDLGAIQAAEKRQEEKLEAKALQGEVTALLTPEEYVEKMSQLDGVNDVSAAIKELDVWLGSGKGTEPTSGAARMLQQLKNVARETALEQHAKAEVLDESLDVYLPESAKASQKISRELAQLKTAKDEIPKLEKLLVAQDKRASPRKPEGAYVAKLQKEIAALAKQMAPERKKWEVRNPPDDPNSRPFRSSKLKTLEDKQALLTERQDDEAYLAELKTAAAQIPELRNQAAAAWNASLTDVKHAQDTMGLKIPGAKRTRREGEMSLAGNEQKKQKAFHVSS